MRTLLPPLLTALIFAPVARADATPPPLTYIPREVVLEFAEPYPGWSVFAVSGNTVRQLPTTGRVALMELLGDNYSTRRMGVELYALPDSLLSELGTLTPSADWFRQHRDHPGIKQGGTGVLSVSTTVADPRGRVVEERRVTLTATRIETELISERTEASGLVVAVYALLFVSLVLLVVWLIRRRNTRRDQPPTEPSGG